MKLIRRVRTGQPAKGDVERIMWEPRRGGTDPRTHRSIDREDAIAVKREGMFWQTYPKDPAEWPSWLQDYVKRNPGVVPSAAARAQAAKRAFIKLDENTGAAVFPFEPAGKDLVKTLAGARWDPKNKRWLVSTRPRDLPRALEVAKRLNLEIDPKFLVKRATEGLSGATMEGTVARVVKAAKRAKTTEGFRPYPFQLQGVEFLARRSHMTGSRACAILGDAMGVGKTIQAVLALPRSARAILVVPTVVTLNWAIELRRWRPDLKVTLINEPKARLDRLPRKGEVLILGYSRLPNITKSKATGWEPKAKGEPATKLLAAIAKARAKLPEETDWKGRKWPARLPIFLIADEAHNLKNPKTKRTQAFTSISDAVGTTWMLTGTPLDNRPPDLWGILQAGGCAGPVFGWGRRGWENFRNLMGGTVESAYYGGPTITVWPPDSGRGIDPRTPELLKRVMLRRMKSEVLPDLPEKRYEWITVALEGREGKAISKELDRLLAAYGTNELPPFEEISRVRQMLAKSRIPAILELVEPYEDAGKPVVVASAHTAPLKALAERPGWEAITGETPQKRRQQYVEDFQAGHLKGLAIAIQAAGVGITLTRADTMIFVDLGWKPGDNAQAEDRIHRIGATSQKVLYRILTSPHPLDQHVNHLLSAKSSIIKAAVDTEMAYEPPPPPPRSAPRAAKDYYKDVLAGINAAQTGQARKKLIQKLISGGHLPGGAGGDPANLLPPFPPSVIAAMQEGLQHLTAICDYAKKEDFCGFNRPDASTGHMLAAVGLADIVAQHVAQVILHKYRGQLGATWDRIYGPKAQTQVKAYRSRQRFR